MLIDKYLPAFDQREYRERRIAAPPDRVYAAFRSLDLERSLIIRTIFAIRTLRFKKSSGRPFLDLALSIGWVILDESPGHELVMGSVTQPWERDVRFRSVAPADFLAFAEPGFTKIVWNITVKEVEPGISLASTETRVLATDPASKRRFRIYWTIFSPGIRLIRYAALGLLKSVASSTLSAEP